MKSSRLLKVSELVKRTVSDIIQKDMKDPLPALVSVTRVEISPDLQHAKIFISVLGNQGQKDASLQKLKSAKGFIRYLLGKRVGLKYTPDLLFITDSSIEYGMHISEVLEKIRKEDELVEE